MSAMKGVRDLQAIDLLVSRLKMVDDFFYSVAITTDRDLLGLVKSSNIHAARNRPQRGSYLCFAGVD